MSFKHTLTLAALSFFIGASAFAANAPANVKNVQAAIINGKLTVTWDPPTDGATIASYRVYYSHQSILGNDGNYDDFEQTNDPALSYTFKALPLSSSVIFIGVLAVNKEGIESDGFEVEATAVIPAGTVASSESSAPIPPTSTQSSIAPVTNTQPSSSVPAAPAPLELMTVETLTDTGVLLTFNKPLLSMQSYAGTNFQITDTGGLVLSVITVKQVDALHVLLTTMKQSPNKTYIIKLLTSVIAEDGGATPPALQSTFFSKTTTVPVTTPGTQPTIIVPIRQYGRNPAVLIDIPVVKTPAKTTKSGLPDSGVGFLGIFLAAGAAAGRLIGRKKHA